jgi:phage baseplate assembly protein W
MDLNLSLTKNPQNNDLLMLNDNQSIRSSIKNLILTNKGERIFQPYLGTNLNKLLFQIADVELANDLIEQIKSVIYLYESRVTINSIDVFLEDDNMTLSATIEYTINFSGVADNITTIIKNR